MQVLNLWLRAKRQNPCDIEGLRIRGLFIYRMQAVDYYLNLSRRPGMAKKRKSFISVLILLISVGSFFILSFRGTVYSKTDAAYSPAEYTEHSLWVGEKKSVIGISINNGDHFSEMTANHLEDIAVDVTRGVIWVGTRKEITKYSFFGKEISHYPLDIKNSCGERVVHISLNQSDGSLWVGAKDEVIKLSSDGEEIFRIKTYDHAVDVSADSSDGTCWVGHKQKVTKYSPEGKPLATFNIENCNKVHALAADPVSHSLWIGSKKGLIKVGSDGFKFHIKEPLDIQDIKIDISDSSVWAVTKKEVFKYSAEGQKLFRLFPCSKEDKYKYHKKNINSRCNDPDDDNLRCEGNLVTLAVDPYDSSCWIAWRKFLLKLSRDGEFLQRLDGFKQIEALDIGYSSTQLSIRIDSPLDGAVFYATPVDISGTVNDSTAAVSVNGFKAAVSGNTFTAPGLMLQEGQNTITAVAGDGYGRTAADTITVTLITKGSITGTVTDSSTGLAISGASVAIKDPLNVIHSTTTDDNGKYTVSGITQGSFAALFEKTGYENNTVTGTLNAGETKTVDVQLTPIKPLAVKITSPLDGAVISATYGDVKGTVSDPAATVIVNGIEAIVSGNTFEAKGIQLTPGPNSITAKATDGNGRTASDTIIVNYNQLSISITYPSEGEVLSTPSVSVEGIISDPSAYVEVNGIPASVSSGGSFIAHGITLLEGTNMITAQGVNTAGQTAEDTVRVYYQPLSSPLSIRVLSPTEGSEIETPYFTVSGVVSDPTATVIINDTIAKVEDNFFSASIYSCKPPITPESVSIKQQSWVCTVTVSCLFK